MANEKQFRLNTRYIATRGVKEYRETITSLVTEEDSILELGCEWGTTTTLLAAQCKDIIGTDVSPECIKVARQRHPALRFEVLDAFDVRAAQAFSKSFTRIYIDLSGFSSYRALLDVIALLNMYATIFQPEIIVIKSGALKQFATHCRGWKREEMSISSH